MWAQTLDKSSELSTQFSLTPWILKWMCLRILNNVQTHPPSVDKGRRERQGWLNYGEPQTA